MGILVDYNQVLIASVSAGHASFGSDLNPNMIRHMFLNSMFSIERKFGKKYGDIVVCCDASNIWRKDAFKYYKAKRKEGRDKSPLDWPMIFDTMDKIRTEITESFPWKLVIAHKAEGDDVIAVITKYLQENELVSEGLFESPQPIIIVSADLDFVQLQIYQNVDQWTPMFKKLIIEKNPTEYRFNKIIRGDAGDGVPNMFSEDAVLVTEGARQKACLKKRVEPILTALVSGEEPPFESDEDRVNYARNAEMIDLVNHSIPQDIVDNIISEYENATMAPRAKMFTYFIKHRMGNLARQLK